MGSPLQIPEAESLSDDSEKRLAIIVSIGGIRLLLQSKQICSGMPIPASVSNGRGQHRADTVLCSLTKMQYNPLSTKD